MKSVAFSRMGIEKCELQENMCLTSKIKAIFDETAEIFRWELRTEMISRYLKYSLEVVKFLDGDNGIEKMEK